MNTRWRNLGQERVSESPNRISSSGPSEEGCRHGVMMNPPSTSRREFVQGSLRWLGAGVVSGVTAWAVLREAQAGCRRPAADGCGACPVYGGCGLPRAEAFRGGVGADSTEAQEAERSEP